MKATSWT